ncbi:MAG TPA: KH domain-containing protein [Patescibacteria group bacterium]|nr:KH domain-containing protein [Patescibacteria group bacterium]
MKDILNYIITSIVEKPDDVNITENEQDEVVNLEIDVAKEDMGKVIGKSGKVIKAIRNIMKIPAIKQNKRIYVSLTEKPQ